MYYINEHDNAPHVVNPLTVADGEKLRLVLDLRYINSFLESSRFKYEDLRTLSEIFESGFYFFTFDLESGYHLVSIVQHHQQFLGFSWLFSHWYGVHLRTKIIENKIQFEVQKLDYPFRNLVI